MIGRLLAGLPVLLAVTALALAWSEVQAMLRVLQLERRDLLRERMLFTEGVRQIMTAARRSPQGMLEVLDRTARSLLPAIETTLFAELDGDALSIRYLQGEQAEPLRGARLDLGGKNILATACRLSHRVVVDAGIEPLIGESAGLALPFVEAGHSRAAIAFVCRDRVRFDESDALVRLVEVAASAYALAVDRRVDQATATLDALTGLLTAGAFRRRLTDAVVAAQRRAQPYALLFIDTDHFKACNDTYGHAVGDAVLAEIAGLLRHYGGDDALVGRNGGDEFCIALPATKHAALRLAERIRCAMASDDFSHVIGEIPLHRLTMSIGVASIPEDAPDAIRLVKAADAAMYHSKRHGRNGVAFFIDADRPMMWQRELEAQSA